MTGVQKHMEKTEVLETYHSYSLSVWIHMTTVRALTYKPLPTEQICFVHGPSHKPALKVNL